ncbi:hypothetical protein PMG71_08940 [Roseofilum sp. BLCC_M154]|uniref:Uncharacterized protein n=1 Tax=Roseofilum acuticapitatum BLCC-M154 TaxID=3022444 RepID=A0ABT7ASZ9_9CYAN|nr:hypothetical protein [Roseofilum acuticapitatum]MDJ1169549.1 hypothetical protein [Roseofilum acuticapitatum BLCC-M154]
MMMRLQYKGWIFIHAIAFTIGLSAIASMDSSWHPISDPNLSIEKVNANSSNPTTLNPFLEKVWSKILPL